MAATNFDELVTEVKNATAAVKELQQKAPFRNVGAPHVTTGPVGQDSKPFSLYNLIRKGLAGGDASACKSEFDMMERFKRAAMRTGCMLQGQEHGHWLPINFDSFGPAITSNSESEADINFCKSMLAATPQTIDPEEYESMRRKGMFMKAQSAFVDNLGGTVVAPPTQGEIIPLIRPNAAALAAGATSMTLPPSGRYVRPRITGAPGATAVVEAGTITESDLTTGEMVLTSKKIGGAVRLSKESSQYTSGAMDRYAQEELNRTLGLKFDQYAFYGTGGAAPIGLTNAGYVNANGVLDVFGVNTSARGIGANGNILLPEYGEIVSAEIKDRSFGLDGAGGKWIMRPKTLAAVRSYRADAVTPGDKSGAFVDILKKFSERGPSVWSGDNVVETTNIGNISGLNSKGSTASGLVDAFYGIWKHMIIATYGAIQFETGHDGTTFLKDQYLVKGTMYGDVGLEYAAAFAWLKQLINGNNAY